MYVYIYIYIYIYIYVSILSIRRSTYPKYWNIESKALRLACSLYLCHKTGTRSPYIRGLIITYTIFFFFFFGGGFLFIISNYSTVGPKTLF